jgi:molybdopterin molybdotransferase
MITFEEACRIVLDNSIKTGIETVPLAEAYGRVLGEDVTSDTDMPPFDKSAVDGYACRRSDTVNKLKVIETIAAGKLPEKAIGANECSKIMTGGMLPEGADCVLMVEDTQVICEKQVKFLKETTAPNICYRAEDIKKGSLVLPKGTLLGPEHIAVMASAGCHAPGVGKRPTVGIISTGDELVEPHEIPSLSKIRNSNSWQLLAQAQKMNLKPRYWGIARDNEEATLAKINQAKEENDVVLLTGGVSMGDFDMVPDMMQKAGFELMFRSVAVQPGKPTVFGRHGNKFCFGLPGNPVSGYVLFELLVKPLLYKMQGHDFRPLTFKMPFATDYNRRRNDRMLVLPVTIHGDGTAGPIDYHGSAHIHSLTFAQAFAFIPVGVSSIHKGDMTDVRLI